MLALLLRQLANSGQPVRPVIVGPAEVDLAEELVADRRVNVEPEHITTIQSRQAVALGTVGIESEPLPEIEPLARRDLVEHQVEVAEGVDDQRPVVAVELADAG